MDDIAPMTNLRHGARRRRCLRPEPLLFRVMPVLVLLCGTAGCSVFRIGALPSPSLGTEYVGLDDLGKHGSITEGHGIAYTSKAGHIDIDHVRSSADWTRDIAEKSLKAIRIGRTCYEFRTDQTLFKVSIQYPEGWNAQSRVDEATRSIVNHDAARFAYYVATWHEIATWYGWRSTFFFPEDPSAFSWEDNVSNALGCQIGLVSLEDHEHRFNDAVTKNLNATLRQLDIRDKATALRAAEMVRGKWFTGGKSRLSLADMTRRHFDIGLENGVVTPWLSPLPEFAGSAPTPIPVPQAEEVAEGFHMQISLKPEFGGRRKILKIVHPCDDGEWILPAEHFQTIVDRIRTEAAQRYGPDVGKP